MQNILRTEINRIIDILLNLEDHSHFDAYIKELKTVENLEYPEIKYYLEQCKDIILTFDNQYLLRAELSAIDNAIKILENTELMKIQHRKELEPLTLFWNSFKLWTEQDLPYKKILKPYYLHYDNWDGGSYYLDINMSSEFTKAYGLKYDNRFDKDCILLLDLKLYIELFYTQFVEDRYGYTKEVNKYFTNFKLPYKLVSGKITKKGYKSSDINPLIVNYPMLESKVLWSEDKILGKEKLDKHTALNYITDSLQYILSLIKNLDIEGKSIYQKCAKLICEDETSKTYSIIKNEVDEIQKIVNEYFDIRHNEYLNKAKGNRESLENSIFIEYLYNRIYGLMYILKTYYSKYITNTTEKKNEDDELPF